MTNPVKVYYLGSGRLGNLSLDALLADPRIRLIGVGTQPDRPAGRNKRLQGTPLACHAESRGIQAERLASVNAQGFLDSLVELTPELLVVASFGQLLKPALLDVPTYGCLNIHASLLPRHRGASPISAAIAAGDETTGITFMRMDPGLDTGPLYRCVNTPILAKDTGESLENRLAALAAEHLVDVIWDVCRNGLVAVPQNSESASYAPKLRKSDGFLDWPQPAVHLERSIRALIPWPKAYFFLPGRDRELRIQVLAASVEQSGSSMAEPGTILAADANGILIACGRDSLRISSLIPEGRREMSAAEFLRGTEIPTGTHLSNLPPEAVTKKHQ